MFTENEMKKRVNKMRFKLRKKDGFDILVTHAPAYQLNDGVTFLTRDFMYSGT